MEQARELLSRDVPAFFGTYSQTWRAPHSVGQLNFGFDGGGV